MLALMKTIYTPSLGIAPIMENPVPLKWGLARLGKALKEALGWSEPEDVYDPRPLNFEGDGPVVGSPPPEWNPTEARHLFDAFLFPLKTDSLIDDFAQSSEGNCALVATIKAAMKKFGAGVFRSVKMPAHAQYRVQLKDGAEVQITDEQLAMTREAAGLRGESSEVKSFAIFAYAVAAARRAQMMPAVDLEAGFVDGWLTENERFQRALKDLGTGHRPKYCAHYLGVGHELRVRLITLEDDITDDSTIVSSYDHAVYVERNKGKTNADHYGQSVEYDGTDTNGRPARERLTFEGPGLQEDDGWFYI